MPRKPIRDEDGNVVKRRRGRPKSDNSKEKMVTSRMTKEEYKRLVNISVSRGLTLSETIVMLINKEDFEEKRRDFLH